MKKNKIKKFFNDYMKWSPSKISVIIFLLMPILINCSFELNNDFWFMSKLGEYIVNKGFPHTDILSMHSDFAFVIQQWLTDVIFYLIYNKFNIYGMYIFTIIMNILIIFIMYKLCMFLSNNRVKLSIFVTVIVNLFLSIGFIATRPQLFDIVLLLSELYLLELYTKSNNKKYLLGLPLISLLMINLHSSIWLMCFVFLLPYYVDNIFNRKYRIKPIIITTIIMLVIAFLNPYGLDAMTYLFRSYGIEYIDKVVGEMNPTTISNSFIIYVYIFLVLLSYYITKNKKINIRYLLLFLGTTYLALEHHRGILFLVLGSIFPLCDNLKQYFIKEKREVKVSKKENLVYIFILVIFFTIYITNLSFTTEEDMLFNKITNYLDNNTTKDIKLYTGYHEGSYFEYKGYKCYIDPRAEHFFEKSNSKKDIFIEYYLLQYGRIDYNYFLEKYDFDYIFVGEKDVLYHYLTNNPNYEKVYEGYDKAKIQSLKYEIQKYILYKKVGESK